MRIAAAKKGKSTVSEQTAVLGGLTVISNRV